MLIDSERFAFQPRRHHAFASSGNAYDATQCDEAIQTGDTLIIIADQVVGIAMTWPFAVQRSICGDFACIALAPRYGRRQTAPYNVWPATVWWF